MRAAEAPASNFNRDGIMSSVLVENGFGIAISCLTSQPTPPRLYTTWQNSLEIYYMFSNPKLHLSGLLFTNKSIHKVRPTIMYVPIRFTNWG